MRNHLLAAASALGLASAMGCAAYAQTPASLPAATNGVIAFTPDFFAAQQPNTALDMVERVPGFKLEDGEDLRGFAGSAGNVLIDGARPASKSDTGSMVLQRTPAARVERIDLIRGGAGGIDMQNYSVVVNVILKPEASREHTVTVEPYLFEGGPELYRLRYEFSSRDNGRQWGLQLGQDVDFDDGTGLGRLTRRDANGVLISNEPMETNFKGGGKYLRGNWSGPVLGGRLELTGSLEDDFWQDGATFGDGVAFRRSNYRDDELSGDLGLRYERRFANDLKLEARLIQNLEDGESTSRSRGFGPDQVFTADYQSGESIARSTLRWEGSPRLTIEGGGEFAYNFLDTKQRFTVGGEEVPLPSATVKVEEVRGEGFLQGTWRPREGLMFEGGVRYERSTISQSGDVDSEKTLSFIKPRVLVTWTPVKSNQFRFRFERELGQLDFGDFAASAALENDQVFGGNVDLEPEQRWISEFVYERRFWGDGVVSLTLRHDEIVDVIDQIPLPDGLSATGNIGDGTLNRVAINLTLPLERLKVPGGRLVVNTKWDRTEVIDPTTGDKRRISWVEHNRHLVSFTQDLPRWKLTYGVDYIPPFKRVRYRPDETVRMEINNYLQFFAEYKPKPDLAIRLQLTTWNDFPYERTLYADRATRAVELVELRQTDPREFVQLRIRKSF
ncbi:TonB-dependent receptor plug domain-containing protein [Caulobacter sp. NIBR2454]|uniref:TonB-dependent receptor plug domain-containing protein n=1 Tax=Caulobacter sp. NIBR2454 TaxID=3015996 RepID=UPI0022B6CB21|nr:TonB-dependent receptor [Caulobacter sp. NIBR2454]